MDSDCQRVVTTGQWTVTAQQWTPTAHQWTVTTEHRTPASAQYHRTADTGQWKVTAEQWTADSDHRAADSRRAVGRRGREPRPGTSGRTDEPVSRPGCQRRTPQYDPGPTTLPQPAAVGGRQYRPRHRQSHLYGPIPACVRPHPGLCPALYTACVQGDVDGTRWDRTGNKGERGNLSGISSGCNSPRHISVETMKISVG